MFIKKNQSEAKNYNTLASKQISGTDPIPVKVGHACLVFSGNSNNCRSAALGVLGEGARGRKSSFLSIALNNELFW